MKKINLSDKINDIWVDTKSLKWVKSPIFWARFTAYAIPLAFLGYVLYINYLPFGYNKTFTIDVGSPGDTRVGTFFLEPSRDLSDRRIGIDENGNEFTYRELNGVANVVFRPNVVLRDATVTIEVEGEGVSIIPPVIDFDPESIDWDYSWDFTQGKEPEELGLVGNAFPFDGGMFFDGEETRLQIPDSQDKFKEAFSVYVEWEPRDNTNNSQQIVGAFDWELYQESDQVRFNVGRMNDAQGRFHSVTYPITDEFLGERHNALAIYNPDPENGLGYIELFVNGNLAGRTYIGHDVIWDEYRGHNNVSFGRSRHGSAQNFNGEIFKIKFRKNNINIIHNFSIIENINHKEFLLYILYSNTGVSIKQIKLHVKR